MSARQLQYSFNRGDSVEGRWHQAYDCLTQRSDLGVTHTAGTPQSCPLMLSGELLSLHGPVYGGEERRRSAWL